MNLTDLINLNDLSTLPFILVLVIFLYFRISDLNMNVKSLMRSYNLELKVYAVIWVLTLVGVVTLFLHNYDIVIMLVSMVGTIPFVLYPLYAKYVYYSNGWY